MERKRSKLQASLLLWATVAVLLSQNLLVSAISAATVEDQKNYYPPDPNAGTPHTGSPSHNPPHSSGGGHGSTPSHGGGGGGGSYGTPSHGGGSYGTPPANCGTPPSEGPATPTPSTPSGGGGSYQPPPTTPSTPTPIVNPPIVNPPTIVSPPTTPGIEPGTPTIPGVTVPPAPPYGFDPNSPPFSCNYWRTHPTLIWGLLGWWGTVGQTLGATSIPGFGSNMSVLQALSNTRTDGFGALYREGTASFLNSMVHRNFPYTTQQVRDTFVGALSSNKAAAHQAQLFKLANEGRVKA
ncbi:protodermal factor 1-like [Coffea arabica]|uniref:Protodermal factor 1-like n=1 Tax=Coffea arabica TaxID=13443 RepID=A0ABM4UCQ0_COFAR